LSLESNLSRENSRESSPKASGLAGRAVKCSRAPWWGTGGATSYLLKTASAEHVIAAVRAAADGTASLSPDLLTRLTQALRRPPPADPLEPLSPRERDVLRLIARGHSNRQIARELAIGEQTVKTHVRSILAKLGLQDRVQAAIFALRHQADGQAARR
jgi:NarL family two-component system response regulator LiaR